MKKLNISNLLFTLTMCLLLAAVCMPLYGSVGIIPSAIVLAYSVSPIKLTPSGTLRNEVLKQLFSDDLQRDLFPDNSFYAGAQTDGAAWNTEKIIIPQDEDGTVEVEVNPKKFPIEMNMEEDTRKEYNADQLVTKTTAISYNNELLTVYSKRAAKEYKHKNSLEKQMAERILHGWSPTLEANTFLTTGATTRAATAPAATGVRKKVTEEDIIGMMVHFDGMDVPRDGGRKLLCPAVLIPDLLAIKKTYGSGTDANNTLLAKGAIMELFTFQVYVRSSSQVYTEAAQPLKKAIGAVGAATDNQSILFWHDRFVRYVKSSVMVNLGLPNDPDLAGGQKFNAMMRGGGTSSRISERGVAVLVEDNA